MSEPAAHRSTASPRLFPVGSLFHSLFPHPVPIDHLIGHGKIVYAFKHNSQPENNVGWELVFEAKTLSIDSRYRKEI